VLSNVFITTVTRLIPQILLSWPDTFDSPLFHCSDKCWSKKTRVWLLYILEIKGVFVFWDFKYL